MAFHMSFHMSLTALPSALPSARPAQAPLPPHPRAAPLARLVLFVGDAIRPDAQTTELLARDGVRSLQLHGTEQAVRAASLARFDAVLIDGRLVDGSAAPAIGQVRAAHGCPVVVVAERADEVDEIVTLELGADLFLARPLAARRLRAHLAALLRRSAPARPVAAPASATDEPVIHAPGGWQLDPVRCRLHRHGSGIELTQAQAALLHCLLDAGGRAVPRGRLSAALRQGDQLSARSIDVYVHRLRQRLREQGAPQLQIDAVRGGGYALRLEEPGATAATAEPARAAA